jgi:hypothetical protein
MSDHKSSVASLITAIVIFIVFMGFQLSVMVRAHN